jgi:hypothetical protein
VGGKTAFWYYASEFHSISQHFTAFRSISRQSAALKAGPPLVGHLWAENTHLELAKAGEVVVGWRVARAASQSRGVRIRGLKHSTPSV